MKFKSYIHLGKLWITGLAKPRSCQARLSILHCHLAVFKTGLDPRRIIDSQIRQTDLGSVFHGYSIAGKLLFHHNLAVSTAVRSMGMIAGNRTLPFLFAEEARKKGVSRLFAVAFENETDPNLSKWVDEIEWVRVGQLNRLIRAFKEHDIQQCVMVGQIAPKNLFDLRPDLRAIAMLMRLKEKNAHTIFGGIAAELGKDGIELVEATPWLAAHMPGKGFTLGIKPSKQQLEEVDFGFRMAKAVSELEIGQTVVVKEGTILAVEGFEGTDECLKRGGVLAGKKGGAVAVKVAKKNHDFRFDIPCVGARTIEICAQAGIRTLAFEAEKTLLLEKDRVEQLARKEKISLVAAG
ncbi:MAG: hypothetical protein JWN25_1364 [Verrucomicrobiales bacterium]|nr:hypothetical protein [Verrucomicrobiales bacterium]